MNLKNLLTAAKQNGKAIQIKGYRHSDGRVEDYVVDFSNYAQMTADALNEIRELKWKADSGVTFELFTQAVDEVRASLHKSLGNVTKAHVQAAGEFYVTECNGLQREGEEDIYAIVSMRRMGALYNQSVGARKSKPLTVAKDYVRQRLSTAYYVPKLLLHSGNYISITVVDKA